MVFSRFMKKNANREQDARKSRGGDETEVLIYSRIDPNTYLRLPKKDALCRDSYGGNYLNKCTGNFTQLRLFI